MSVARHPRPATIADGTLDQIAERFVKRFCDTQRDCHAYADAEIEGNMSVRWDAVVWRSQFWAGPVRPATAAPAALTDAPVPVRVILFGTLANSTSRPHAESAQSLLRR